jgi:uncharacterized protein (DUF433 family)
MKRVKLGRHVVSDPHICHGTPTFIGTRIMVDQVLEMVAAGTPWEEIIAEYDGAISRAAIAEAVRLARRSFREKCSASYRLNILDENIIVSQRAQLRKWRIRFNHIGTAIGRQGMKDLAEIVPLFHRLRRPTSYSRFRLL